MLWHICESLCWFGISLSLSLSISLSISLTNWLIRTFLWRVSSPLSSPSSHLLFWITFPPVVMWVLSLWCVESKGSHAPFLPFLRILTSFHKERPRSRLLTPWHIPVRRLPFLLPLFSSIFFFNFLRSLLLFHYFSLSLLSLSLPRHVNGNPEDDVYCIGQVSLPALTHMYCILNRFYVTGWRHLESLFHLQSGVAFDVPNRKGVQNIFVGLWITCGKVSTLLTSKFY